MNDSPNGEVVGTAPRILFEQGGLIALNKPAGWIVHPAGRTNAPVVSLWLAAHLAVEWVSPLQRLDRETSGVVLFASKRDVAGLVSAALARRELKKQYLALVAGRTNEKGIVRLELEDERRGRPLEAVTRYRTIERLGGFSLVQARPEHGRKHQIRRHLASIGHPIVGDTEWGPRRPLRCPGFPGRLWLHAARVELPDDLKLPGVELPIDRVFEAPLANELQAHLEILRAGQKSRPGG